MSDVVFLHTLTTTQHRRRNETTRRGLTQNECQSVRYIDTHCECVWLCGGRESGGGQKPNSFEKREREKCIRAGRDDCEWCWFDARVWLFTMALGATICQWWGPQEERRNGGPSNTTRRCVYIYRSTNTAHDRTGKRGGGESQSIGGNKKKGRGADLSSLMFY